MKDSSTVLANDRYHELKQPWLEPAYFAGRVCFNKTPVSLDV
jgi:hypothetical protein